MIIKQSKRKELGRQEIKGTFSYVMENIVPFLLDAKRNGIYVPTCIIHV